MSVYERNGHWHLSITINGKRIRKAIKEARTKKQAEQAERKLRDEIFENRFGVGGQKLFGEFVEKSYKPYARAHKRGYDVELSSLKPLVETFGKKRLYEITPEQIEAFKRRRTSETTTRGTIRARSTVNREIAVLSAVFNLAKSFGEVKANPVSSVKYFGNLQSRDRVLLEDEEKLLFESIGDDKTLARQVEILLYTGLRRGELFKLEWRDVDLKDGFLNLRAETTKTNRARSVPMLDNVRAVFEALRNEAGDVDNKALVFPGIKTLDKVFSSKFKEHCDKLGFENLVVHSLRHTFSTRLHKQGVSPFVQKEILGHSKLTMTANYTHVTKETLRAELLTAQPPQVRQKDTNLNGANENSIKGANLLHFKKKQ